MANSPTKVFNELFNNANPQGNYENSFAALLLLALASRNADETFTNAAAEVLRQLSVLLGGDESSLAFKYMAQQLNTLRERYARQ